jgi:hypothetical protein
MNTVLQGRETQFTFVLCHSIHRIANDINSVRRLGHRQKWMNSKVRKYLTGIKHLRWLRSYAVRASPLSIKLRSDSRLTGFVTQNAFDEDHRSFMAAEVVVVAAWRPRKKTGPAAVEAGAVVEEAVWRGGGRFADDPKDAWPWTRWF